MDHSVRLFGLQHTHTTYRANLPSVHLDVCGTVPAAPGLVFPAGLRQSLRSVYCYSRGSLPIDMDSLHHRKNSSGLHHVLEVMPDGHKWKLKKWIQLQDCDLRGGVRGQMIRCNVRVVPTPEGSFSMDDGSLLHGRFWCLRRRRRELKRHFENEFAETVNCRRISLDLLIS